MKMGYVTVANGMKKEINMEEEFNYGLMVPNIMLFALDKVTPGIASDETLLYGVEVKFYSNKVLVDKNFETSVQGLRAMGDGASVTRGLQQASANGISVARAILAKMEKN